MVSIRHNNNNQPLTPFSSPFFFNNDGSLDLMIPVGISLGRPPLALTSIIVRLFGSIDWGEISLKFFSNSPEELIFLVLSGSSSTPEPLRKILFIILNRKFLIL